MRRRCAPRSPPFGPDLRRFQAIRIRSSTERFIGFWRAAERDPASFYARFRHLDEAGVRGVAAMVWREINLPNLREHISRGREVADIVVTKGQDHRILSVRERPRS